MSYKENLEKWQKNVKDEALLNELSLIINNENELKHRFSNYLQFSTSGLRGIIGVGTNFINAYNIGKVTQGIADYLTQNQKSSKVVIAFDNRRFSKEWSSLAANILAKNGVKVYLFEELTPTPILSFAVRSLQASLGINLTSSHNSKEYNGYKVVDHTGCQVDTALGNMLIKHINQVDEFKVKTGDFNKYVNNKKIVMLNRDYTDKYIKQSLPYLQGYDFNKTNLSIVYSPFNGTGKYSVLKTLSDIGFSNVFVPEQQKEPDENFTTVPNPNPELEESFKLSLKLAKKKKADIVIATDPDCDRVGAWVRHNKKYIQLTGDQFGAVLLYYILQTKQENKETLKNTFFVTSVVSSVLTEKIANYYKVKTHKTLTGFKHIGKKVEELIISNNTKPFNFAYEESCGYMVTPNIRDKDGIMPSALFAIVAAKLKNQGKTVVDYLEEIYQKVGYVINNNFSKDMHGFDAKQKMDSIVNRLRENLPVMVNGLTVISIVDYLKTKLTKLESSNFIEINLENSCKIIVRPSGTEPKIKFYLTSVSDNYKNAQKQMAKLEKYINKTILK